MTAVDLEILLLACRIPQKISIVTSPAPAAEGHSALALPLWLSQEGLMSCMLKDTAMAAGSSSTLGAGCCCPEGM